MAALLRLIAHASDTHVCSATGLLFDWLHPAHFPTIVAAIEAWADVPDVRFYSSSSKCHLHQLLCSCASMLSLVSFQHGLKLQSQLQSQPH